MNRMKMFKKIIIIHTHTHVWIRAFVKLSKNDKWRVSIIKQWEYNLLEWIIIYGFYPFGILFIIINKLLYDVLTRVRRARVTCTNRRLVLNIAVAVAVVAAAAAATATTAAAAASNKLLLYTHVHTVPHTHTHTRSLPESDMITINRSVASIVAAKCIQFLITGRRNSSKQDGTPSAVRSRIARLVAKFSGEIFQRRRLSGQLHPYLKRMRRRAYTCPPKQYNMLYCKTVTQ